jgi:hypothetical protein
MMKGCQTTKHIQCRQDHALNCSQTMQNTMQGRKRRWCTTSAECSTAITLYAAVHVLGNSLPTFLVFQRVQITDHLNNEGPTGTKVVCHSNNWMTRENSAVFY